MQLRLGPSRSLELLDTHKKTLIAAILLLDACIGLLYGVGSVAWSGLFAGDLKWMFQSFEMFIGGFIFIHSFFEYVRRTKPVVAFGTLIILTTVLIVLILQLLLSSLGKSSTVNYNLSSVGMSGLYWTAAYLSVAAGLALTYKVQRFGNFAQAEMMLIGAYVAITLMWSEYFFPISSAPEDGKLDWSLLICAGLAAFLLTGFVGVVIDRFVYRKFRKKAASPQVMMIASLGIAMVIRAFLYMRFSAGTFRFVPDTDWRLVESKFSVPTKLVQFSIGDRGELSILRISETANAYGFAFMKVALVVGVIASVVILMFILYKTRLGRKMRAVSDNSDLAASSGIDVERVHSTSAFLSAGISGLGGAMLAGVLPINPELGITLLLPAFAVLILGTIGSIPGVFIGALVVGLVRSTSEPFLIGIGNALDRPTMSGFAEVMPFVFLIAVLLLLPRGIGDVLTQWNIDRMKKRDHSKYTIGLGSGTTGREIFGSIRDNFASTITILNNQCNLVFANVRSKLIWILRKAAYLGNVFRLVIALFSRLLVKTSSTFGTTKRETERGSWVTFGILFFILVLIVLLLPSATALTKIMQVARVVSLLGIFSLLAISLNLHTGITGMTNFGVIFFAGLGAIIVGILCAPVETNGYGWAPWQATILAVCISGLAGWLLAYPTARLRMDYFAIVTISLGEILSIALRSEPLLRAGTVTSAIGISQYTRPFEDWWNSGVSKTVGSSLGLPGVAPYVLVLALMCVICVPLVWWLLNTVLRSPWGRILRSIREDEEVSQHHGHSVLIHKASSLAMGAAIAGLAGAIWAWLNTGIFPEFMNPVRSTFLVWAAFIVGGRGNNRGMIIGAFLIVIVDFFFNVMVVARGGASLPFHGIVTYIDSAFRWFIVDLGGLVWSDMSIDQVFKRGIITANLEYLKLALIGGVIVGTLQLAPKGLLPEIPSRPERSVVQSSDRGKTDE